MNRLVALVVGASVLAACANPGPESGLPTVTPSLSGLPTPSVLPCDRNPAMSPVVRDAIERELRTPALYQDIGLKSAATIARVRVVRELAPQSSAGAAITAAVFDATAGGRTVTIGLAVSGTATTAKVEDWNGQLPPEDVGSKTVPLKVGRALFAEFVFTYGTTPVPLVRSVKEVLTTSGGASEEFVAPVCNEAFILGGRGSLPQDFIARDRIELLGSSDTSLLSVDLDVGPFD